jgi:anti-sigma factor RsiW
LPRKLLHASTPSSLRSAWRRLRPALAVAATLMIGVGLGWYGRDELLRLEGTPVTFSRQAALTHALYAADQNRPVEVWAAEEQRLVTWLSKRLGFQLRAPDLNSLGYSLVGGRLVAGNEKPGALFMYENADKQRISLLVRKDDIPSHETAFRYAREDGVSVFYWIDESCGYAISGRIERTQLLAIARVVYGQLAAFEAAQPPRP